MIFSSLLLAPVLGFALRVNAQCVTAGWVPCLVPGASVAAAPPVLSPYGGGSFGGGGSGFWSSVSGAASDPIQRRSLVEAREASPLLDGSSSIEKRQNSLCCRPAPVECLYADNIPFCYTPATTRLYFSDGSMAFLSNDTFYGSDGTFINYATGVYIYPNGTEVDFTPDGSAASSSVDSSSPSTAPVVESTSSAAAKATPATGATTPHTTPSSAATPIGGGPATTTSSGSQSTSSSGAVATSQPGLLIAVLGMAAALI